MMQSMMQDSPDVERLVASAATEQLELGHDRVGTEHLLLALLADEGSGSAQLLTAAGATLSAARHMVSEVAVGQSDPTRSGDGVRFTSRAQRALDRAGRFARQERAGEITERHVLLGVLDVEGLACQVLRRLGVDLSRLRSAIGVDADEVGEPAGTDPTEDTGNAAETADAAGSGEGDARPLCGVCRARLDDTLAITTVTTTGGIRASLRIVHCGSCGAAIGVTP
jgi:ATP-dependent Clp protease ATP-binding subunit ClpA